MTLPLSRNGSRHLFFDQKTYDKGVRIAKAAFKPVDSRLLHDKILP